MSNSPFKAYDVRGLIPDQMNVPFAYRFGQAVAHLLKANSVVVGHDMRLDSAPFADAISQGLMDSGVNVLPVGQCGTEEVYFHTDTSGADGGLMVTASHNPQNYNGIKMVLKGAHAATRDNALGPLEELVMSDTPFTPVSYENRGKKLPQLDRAPYIQRLLNQVDGVALKPLKIVCHAGNGCAGSIIDLLEEHLPFTFIKVDHEADGNLPNGIPNPLLPEKRAKAANAVKEHGADLGIAWDGDFDRCFFYDHTGEFVEGYYLVGLIAQTLLHNNPGGKIVYDPRLTWNTIDVVQAAGGVPIISKTGHAFFKQIMREENAIYGGEMSAHHYFDDFSFCDTGMVPWLAIVSEISTSGKSLKEMVEERIAKFPCSGEINFTVNDAPSILAEIEKTYAPNALKVEHIDGVSIEFDDWRFNVRSSNTEPLLRINVEARGDKALVDQKVVELSKLINAS
ncbi:phosphomannomutase [Maritalea porphyrae]|jgi:phosphomannomutase/phosphoglucomutase|uniref:phosphomannomutase n=1 Tax=Maritalea porphyrae TaxID=880732 RepID=UPI0022AEE381|nr:phosphomannomutase [Maritalea porphyrae]MCZ4273834.1 phosphomannomutase [Maritalea porphyrae]